MKKNRVVKIVSLITLFAYVLMTSGILASYFVFHETNYLATTILVISVVTILVLYFTFTNYHNILTDDIEANLDSSVKEALKQGGVGVLVYNEDYEITYMSPLFNERQINRIGEKVLVWLPELQDLLSGRALKTTVVINDDKYEVAKNDYILSIY